MLGNIICRLTSHAWDPEDINEVTYNMELGDEATLRCARCNKQIVTVEKSSSGLKWIPHDDEAILYDLTDEYKIKHGMKTDINKFREANK